MKVTHNGGTPKTIKKTNSFRVDVPQDVVESLTKIPHDNKPSVSPLLSLGILIPLYQYPGNIYTNPTINGLIDLIRQYRTVQTTVVINPGNGPGTVTDGNYAALIKRVRAAGGKVLGYVATGYDARDTALITADVDAWVRLYPGIDGIFYDEMANSGLAGSAEKYAEIKEYAHAAGYWPVVGNPGTGLPEVYFAKKSADQYVIYETDSYPAEATLKGDYAGGYADYDFRERAAMVHGVALDEAKIRMMAKHVGQVYITDDLMVNPYDVLPTYLPELYALAKTL